jgi:hypothetical protein
MRRILTTRRRLASVALALSITATPRLFAQGAKYDVALRQAQTLLDNLRYDDARISALPVAASDDATLRQRVRALQLVASTFVVAGQPLASTDSARAADYLRQALRLDSESPLAREVASPALDRLFNDVRSKGLFIRLRVPDSSVSLAGTDSIPIPVRVTRPATIRLLVDQGHDPFRVTVVADSARRGEQAVLYLRGVRDGHLILSDSAHAVRIQAVDSERGDTVETRIPIDVRSLALQFLPIPHDTGQSNATYERYSEPRGYLYTVSAVTLTAGTLIVGLPVSGPAAALTIAGAATFGYTAMGLSFLQSAACHRVAAGGRGGILFSAYSQNPTNVRHCNEHLMSHYVGVIRFGEPTL